MIRFGRKPIWTSIQWNAKSSAIVIPWVAMVLAYALYSGINQTGLYTWIIYLQFKLFGVAWEIGPYVCIAALVAGLPIYLVELLQKRGFLLSAGNAGAPQNIVRPGPAGAAGTVKWSKKAVAAACLAPGVVCTIIWAYLFYVDRVDRHRQVYQMDLKDAGPPPNSKFLTFSGVLQPDYEYSVKTSEHEEIKDVTTYVPVTSPQWTVHEPVRYILWTRGDEKVDFEGFEDERALHTFGARLSGASVPVYVVKYLEKRHVSVADPMVLLEWKGDATAFDDGIPSEYESQKYVWVLYAGIFLTGVIFLSAVATSYKNRLLAARNLRSRPKN